MRSFAGGLAALLAAAPAMGDLYATDIVGRPTRADPMHPSHRMTNRRPPYCAVCGLAWPYRLLWEPCVGGPHPDSDLRFRQAVEKRARKAAKAVERAAELRDRLALRAAAMDTAVERAIRSGVLR